IARNPRRRRSGIHGYQPCPLLRCPHREWSEQLTRIEPDATTAPDPHTHTALAASRRLPEKPGDAQLHGLNAKGHSATASHRLRQDDPQPHHPPTATGSPTTVDPGSMTRAQRAALPLSADVAQVLAEQHGVCVRPLAMRRIDTTTGRIDIIPVPCGSIRDDHCRPCADKARRLRMAQCRQGWHLDTEPVVQRTRPSTLQQELMAI